MEVAHSITALISAALTDGWRAGWRVLLWSGMTVPWELERASPAWSGISDDTLGDRQWHTSSAELVSIAPPLGEETSAWPW